MVTICGSLPFSVDMGLFSATMGNAHVRLTEKPWKRNSMNPSNRGFLITLAVFASMHHCAAQSWTGTSAPTRVTWAALAGSADGTKLAAAASWPNWSVYVSSNSGATWTAMALNIGLNCLVSSADGTKLAGAQENDGFIFTSTNSGASWTQTSAPQRYWYFMTCSTNLTKLAAIGEDGQPGPIQIYTSGDSGTTWTLSSAPATNWNGLASSADGTKLIASTGGNGIFYTSTDSGTTWSPQTNEPNIWWGALASSADGTKLAAVAVGGGIYTSTNAGTNWTQQTDAPDEDWQVIASSADGTTLVAAVNPSGFGIYTPSPIYTSTNSGLTWTSNNVPQELWTGVFCSADGSQWAACSANISTNPYGYAPDQIITSRPHLWMSMAVTGANVTVLWPWPAANYQLQQNPDVTTTNWVNVTNPPLITNYQSGVTLPNYGNKRFFRLINTSLP